MELLNKIQQELKVPKAHQKAGLPYKYRNAEDILEAVKPLLGKDGTLVLTDSIVQVGERYYVKATANLSDGKSEISAEAFAREVLSKSGTDEAKITGAASSYARKYALNGLFCIDDTKDADDDDAPKVGEAKAAKVAPPKKVGDALKAEIKALVDDKVLEPIEVEGQPREVTAAKYAACVLEQTGLKLEEGNYSTIIERLKAQQ